MSTEKRRQLKLNFPSGPSGGLVFPQPQAQMPVASNCFPGLPNSSPHAFMKMSNDTSVRQKPSLGRLPKNNQDFIQEKTR